ncbi:MAG: hypothetical protein HYZ36_00205, partial [Pedosphaera parvula]|nr:hypothetical protein [Pedosphaera parvula]
SRCPKLEAILAAKYEFETAAQDEQAARRAALEELLRQAVAESAVGGVTVQRLEDSLRDAYREFARAKRIEERQRLSRLR